MLQAFLDSITKPSELSALYKYKFSAKSASAQRLQQTLANDASKKRCYDFLNMTSRSFAAVIQELDESLRDAVCLFYLILRGLDTIEDDMGLDLNRKVELLKSFDRIIYQKGWTFDENGPDEKDRELLVHFDVVIDEFLRLKPEFQAVIANITKLMGDGMADYATGMHREGSEDTEDTENCEKRKITSIATIKDFDLYCHYVAGLVGYGLSDLFVASGLESKEIADKALSNSMGLFLQKTNIIRDYREDLDDRRQFWPREIWGKYADDFSDFTKPENKLKAQYCLSNMVLNVLNDVPQVLTYLSKLRNQSVFNFCAIPQVMAISTLALVFNNLDIYHRNIKIRKGEAVKLIMDSTDMDNVVSIFRQYVFEISRKNDATDPNFMEISMAIGRIEQWIAANYKPSPRALQKAQQPNLFLPIILGIIGILFAYYFKST